VCKLVLCCIFIFSFYFAKLKIRNFEIKQRIKELLINNVLRTPLYDKAVKPFIFSFVLFFLSDKNRIKKFIKNILELRASFTGVM
jgi:hypothetical protein